MANRLSFPTLKCVLEHLEANKRIHISSRSPTLGRFEKSTPLKADHIRFEDFKITINNITYEVKSTRLDLPDEIVNNGEIYADQPKQGYFSRVLMPGDVALETITPLRYFERTEIVFRSSDSGRLIRRQAPRYREQHVAMKEMAEFLFGGRRIVKVNRLNISLEFEKIIRLPTGLKFRAKKLGTEEHDIDAISKILDESSYPLKFIRTSVWKPHYHNHQILQSAGKLSIYTYGSNTTSTYWLGELLKLSSKHVELIYNWLPQEDILTLIKSWLTNNREIGTCYEIGCSPNPEYLFGEIKEQFNGVEVNLKEPDSRLLQQNPEIISIPMSSISELCVYGIQNTATFIKLEVMPIGSTVSVKQNSSKSFWSYFF